MGRGARRSERRGPPLAKPPSSIEWITSSAPPLRPRRLLLGRVAPVVCNVKTCISLIVLFAPKFTSNHSGKLLAARGAWRQCDGNNKIWKEFEFSPILQARSGF